MGDLLASLLVFTIRYVLFGVEGLAVLLSLRAALHSPLLGDHFFRRAEEAFMRLARRKTLVVVLAGLLPMVVRLALVGIVPPRLPHIADDTAYVLAGDTYALGRLTNPTHPLWVHFETFHVNQQPTYMSMYFPAQGFFMAAGKVLAGHLWAGVLVSVGLMCAALCWMLQGWLPPQWALLGGLLAVIRLGIFGYWMNSYFGGAVPALGGAVVLGALPRLIRRRRIRDSALLAAGLAILANSRPYEGMLLALPVGVFLLGWLLGKKRPPVRVITLRVVLPLLVILGAAAGWMGYYNWRVTGDALRSPYQVNRSTYVQTRYFLWERPRPPVEYRHKALHDFYVGEQLKHDLESRSLAGLAKTYAVSARDFWLFYLGPALTVPLMALPWLVRDRRIRFLLLAGAFSVLGLAANL